MDFVIELIFEIVVEGSLEVVSSDIKVPMVLRVIMVIISGAVLLATLAILIAVGVSAIKSGSIAAGVALFLVDALLVGGLFYKVRKHLKSR